MISLRFQLSCGKCVKYRFIEFFVFDYVFLVGSYFSFSCSRSNLCLILPLCIQTQILRTKDENPGARSDSEAEGFRGSFTSFVPCLGSSELQYLSITSNSKVMKLFANLNDLS